MRASDRREHPVSIIWCISASHSAFLQSRRTFRRPVGSSHARQPTYVICKLVHTNTYPPAPFEANNSLRSRSQSPCPLFSSRSLFGAVFVVRYFRCNTTSPAFESPCNLTGHSTSSSGPRSKCYSIYRVHGRASHKAASTVSTIYSTNHFGHVSERIESSMGSAYCGHKNILVSIRKYMHHRRRTSRMTHVLVEYEEAIICSSLENAHLLTGCKTFNCRTHLEVRIRRQDHRDRLNEGWNSRHGTSASLPLAV